jgi:hypothetical protein
MGAPVLTVGDDRDAVEELLGKGLLSCPGCGGRLARHGFARPRRVFGPGRVLPPGEEAVVPRRARCCGCGSTHVLLPASLLSRRADGTGVIGDMLARAARGQGHRGIAAASGVPEGTVRDRLRRFRSGAGRVREFFTRLAGVLAVDPVPLDPAGSPLADAVVAVAAAAAARERWPGMLAVTGWELAAAVTNGSLLSPVTVFARVHGGAVPSALA